MRGRFIDLILDWVSFPPHHLGLTGY